MEPRDSDILGSKAAFRVSPVKTFSSRHSKGPKKRDTTVGTSSITNRGSSESRSESDRRRSGCSVGTTPRALTARTGKLWQSDWAAMASAMAPPIECPTRMTPRRGPVCEWYTREMRSAIKATELRMGDATEGMGLPPYPGRWTFNTSCPRSLKTVGYLMSFSNALHLKVCYENIPKARIVEICRVGTSAVDKHHQSPRGRGRVSPLQ